MPPSDAPAPYRPTMLAASARAATAAEARFRISYPFAPRDTRVVAVDGQGAEVVGRAAARPWTGHPRFLTVEAIEPADGEDLPVVRLRDESGERSVLATELVNADLVVMVAGYGGAEAVEAIGMACAKARIMTAGVVLGGWPPGASQRAPASEERTLGGGTGEFAGRVNDAVLALRPYAMVLVPARDDDEFYDLLTALRV